jgi:soluble lytic murein transglycosylase
MRRQIVYPVSDDCEAADVQDKTPSDSKMPNGAATAAIGDATADTSVVTFPAAALPAARAEKAPVVASSVVVPPPAAEAVKPKRPGVMRHLGVLSAGAINTVAAAGMAVAALSYTEAPWQLPALSWPDFSLKTVISPDAPVATASLPDKPTQRVFRPDTVTVPGATPRLPEAQPAATPPVELVQVTQQPVTPEPTPPGAAPPAPTEPPSPAPKLMTREKDYIAKMDALLAPTRALAISVEEATRIRDAFAQPQSAPNVRALRDQTADPVARKLIDWSLLRGGSGTAREVRNFLAENPEWPNRDLLTQRSEEYHFLAGGNAKDIKAFFADQEPRTAIGRAALASALMAEQDEASAAKLAAWAWRDGDIPTLLETGFIERFGKLLTEADHKYRLDRLLLNDSRWDNERRDRAAVIKRVIPFLSEPERAKANARLAVYLRSPDANKLMAALPADAATSPQPDWGFAFQLAQWHRRGGRWLEAWTILKSAPTDAATAVNLDDWWEERRVSAYDALKAGRVQDAYDLVKSPGDLGVNERKDQAFLAGWIAAKHLNDPAAAARHFRELEAAADGPLARGKAGWWLAKLAEAEGDQAKSKAYLESAAKNVDTFYGMLARQALNKGATALQVSPPALPTAAEAKTFNSRDAVKALVMARRAGLDQSITRAFIAHLRNTLTSEPEQAMIAHLAEAIGDTQMAVRVGKSAVARGLNLITYAYPVHAMPAYQPLRPAPEPALLLGVARQESEFSNAIKSGAGARGLLQVMPITANHVCKDYRLKCEIERLNEPAYNAMMASAYLADRMDEFSGSYVLTLAGYNAGPGRTRQWIREFGDPREPGVDPIDWIHRIPFEETRDYVLKVMSNIQIYRARLGNEATALTLTTDLRRSAPPLRRAAASGG